MGRPRKNTGAARNNSSSSDVSNSDKLDTILEKLSTLDAIKEKLSKVETLLAATQAETAQLKAKTEAQESTIIDLKNKLNNLEQHGRSFSIRINNIPLDGIDEREPPAIIKKVYEVAFLPILQGAASQRAISAVPSCYEMVEMAHTLPGPSDRAKPIIVRFFNRNLDLDLRTLSACDKQPGVYS
jgi:restriction endonuclease S subunit